MWPSWPAASVVVAGQEAGKAGVAIPAGATFAARRAIVAAFTGRTRIGQFLAGFLIDRMTGSGRDRVSPGVTASRLWPAGPSR